MGRLRKEIEPLTQQDFMRFLFRWHHVDAESRLRGSGGLARVTTLLQGWEAPAAAWERELFPTRIRYSSMSLPYHIGNGWFGGFLPFIAAALVVRAGDIYYGLWYPIVVALGTGIIGVLFMRETREVDLRR